MRETLVQKFMNRLKNQLPSLKEQEVLFKNIYSMVENNEPDKNTKIFVRKRLKELAELAELNTEEKVMKLESGQLKKKELLLERFHAEDGDEAMAKVFGALNRQYNLRDTEHSRYLDLKVQLLDYCAKNRKESEGLENLSHLARRYRAYVLAGEIEKYQLDLSKEERDLHKLVERLNPENQSITGAEARHPFDYYQITQYLQKKISLYEGKGRVKLLGAYQRFLKDYDDSSSMKLMWIDAANRYLCSRKLTLQEQTLAAQNLRKPVGVTRNDIKKNKLEKHL